MHSCFLITSTRTPCTHNAWPATAMTRQSQTDMLASVALRKSALFLPLFGWRGTICHTKNTHNRIGPHVYRSRRDRATRLQQQGRTTERSPKYQLQKHTILFRCGRKSCNENTILKNLSHSAHAKKIQTDVMKL